MFRFMDKKANIRFEKRIVRCLNKFICEEYFSF